MGEGKVGWCLKGGEARTIQKLNDVWLTHKPSFHNPLCSHICGSLTLASNLQLAPQQIPNHLSTSDPRRPPQSREVQGGRKGIGIPEAQHRWDPTSGILEGETCFIHLVLLDGAAMKMVHASLRIDFWFVGAWCVGKLGPSQDVEVIIGCVPTRVAFCAYGCTENDQILSDTCVLDQHSDGQRSCDMFVLQV